MNPAARDRTRALGTRLRGMPGLAGLVTVAVLTAATVGCGHVGGGPESRAQQDAGPVVTSAAESSTAAEDAAGGSGSEAVDPCAWLDPADRSTAGLTEEGQRRDVAGAPSCDYTESGTGGVTITVDDTSGLDALRTAGEGEAERMRIGGRDAMRVADLAADDGTCAVLLATGPSSSVHVDVSSVDFTDTESSCVRARTVAELIAPDLPGGPNDG
ncbi:DUF3558 family protein [Prauserella rugosa]|uniref:Uncharacterized protein DUF3558 n=1 Tax=Prauserella rugosa TaxID=43354 RepID=A0A660CDH2_9PSEU|nr:DUF3558 family protein [Prauserella rugosa]TWH18971.1 uncharacterized protein DUF3558 [Prauserella rugosa]